VQVQKQFDGIQKTLLAGSAPMPGKKQTQPKSPVSRDMRVAKRLADLRVAMGKEYENNQYLYATKFLGLDYARYNNWERGLPLPLEPAKKIVEKIPGLTLDWLIRGIPDGLPIHLARKLGVYPGQEG
jgi:hypothetical protein